MKRLHKIIAYVLICLVSLKALAAAVNTAQTPEELDNMVLSSSAILSE